MWDMDDSNKRERRKRNRNPKSIRLIRNGMEFMEKTTLLNNGKIINHIGHFGRTQIQKCLLLLLRHILALNWVCLALSMVHFLWEKHCSSDFFLLLFLLYFMCGNCTTYRCIDNRIEWKCFSISFRCFPFSFFSIFPSLFFLSHHFSSLFFLSPNPIKTHIFVRKVAVGTEVMAALKSTHNTWEFRVCLIGCTFRTKSVVKVVL